MGAGAAVHDGLAELDVLAFEDEDVPPLRHQRLVAPAFVVGDDDALLALGLPAEAHHPALLGEDRRLLGTTGLEEVRDPRKTSGDVPGLRGLLGKAGDDVSHLDSDSVHDVEHRAGGQRILGRDLGSRKGQAQPSIIADQEHRRAKVRPGGATLLDVQHLETLEAGQLVELALDRYPVHDVAEPDLAGHLADDGVGVRVPGRHHLCRFDPAAVDDRQHGAVRHLVPLPLATVGSRAPRILRSATRQTWVPSVRATSRHVLQPHGTTDLDRNVVRRGLPRCGAPDVEGTHRQLGSRLADRLGGDHPDGLAEVHYLPTREIAPVAAGANPEPGLAGDG